MTRKWMGPVIVAVMVAVALWAYPQLPERVPSHWNMRGEVDGWSGRWIVFMPAVVGLALWALMQGLRRIDPRSEHYSRFEGTFWLVVNLTVAFMIVVQLMMVGAALGWTLPGADVIMILAVGVLLLVLGNVLPRVRSNWWMGVRTPWTLSSETVWRSTHRVAGRTFMLGGLLVLAGVALPSQWRAYLVMTAVLLSAVVPAFWSWREWRREQEQHE